MNTDLRRRFDAKWHRDPATGCWLWDAGCTSGGYGTFGVCVDGRWHMERAHRVAWTLYRGPIPPGTHVLHHCDTPPCVCPDCLFLGDQAANNADMVAKGRQVANAGTENGRAVLTETDALAIIELRDTERQVDTAKRFGVSQRQVSRIQLGHRWAHLQVAA